MGYTYFGESAGGRILRYGVGVSQVGGTYQLEMRPWEIRPAGEAGRVVFRTITCIVRHTAGYDISIQPVVDGRPLTVQRFSGGAPAAGLLEAESAMSAIVFVPGNRLDCILKSVNLLAGELEVIDLQATFQPIRSTQ